MVVLAVVVVKAVVLRVPGVGPPVVLAAVLAACSLRKAQTELPSTRILPFA